MMISRRPQSIIGKVNWGSGGKSGSAISPRSPLEIMNIQSPRGPKKFDFVGGVGLGIVAALEKSEHSYVSHHRDTAPKPILHTRNQSISNHVPLEMENSEEDYTFVTCHEPSKTNTRVYYNDGVGNFRGETKRNDTRFDTKSAKKHGTVMFDISASRFSDEVEDFPDNDFLEFCYLCRKTLHGKDIYMYRGEKAFCSTECRCVEMVKDERKKSRSDVVSSR